VKERPILKAVLIAVRALPVAASAQDEASKQNLITTVNVWDGTSESLAKADVLVEGHDPS